MFIFEFISYISTSPETIKITGVLASLAVVVGFLFVIFEYLVYKRACKRPAEALGISDTTQPVPAYFIHDKNKKGDGGNVTVLLFLGSNTPPLGA